MEIQFDEAVKVRLLELLAKEKELRGDQPFVPLLLCPSPWGMLAVDALGDVFVKTNDDYRTLIDYFAELENNVKSAALEATEKVEQQILERNKKMEDTEKTEGEATEAGAETTGEAKTDEASA